MNAVMERDRVAAVRHAFIVEDWKPMVRNTLRGFCTVTLPSGMILSDVSVHIDHARRGRCRPAKPC